MQGASSASEVQASIAGTGPGPPERWTSQFAFVLAALGSAVGLGNIWRFPYIAGENGGGAFVLVYLAFVLLIGLPALIATVMIGRRGARSPIRCLERVAEMDGRSPRWRILGWLLVLGAFFLLSIFSVVASWILDYTGKAVVGAFTGLERGGALTLFDALKADPLRLAVLHGLFVGVTLAIVSRGIRRGIERAIKLMMPLLFVLLILLTGYALTIGDGAAALAFLFAPEFGELTGRAVLLAVGQALLTLSVGGAGMLVYGAYLSREASIPRACTAIAVIDTMVALLAGLMIFPIVFGYQMTPDQGPGLIFVTLPIAFGQMPGGTVFAVAFFILLLLAAWSSAVSMFEPVVAWLTERFAMTRARAACLAGFVLWLLGLLGVFSFNIWSQVRPLAAIDAYADLTIFQSLEYTVTGLLMPGSTLVLAVFAGWLIAERGRREEFGLQESLYALWRVSLRYFVPAGIGASLLMGLASGRA